MGSVLNRLKSILFSSSCCEDCCDGNAVVVKKYYICKRVPEDVFEMSPRRSRGCRHDNLCYKYEDCDK